MKVRSIIRFTRKEREALIRTGVFVSVSVAEAAAELSEPESVVLDMIRGKIPPPEKTGDKKLEAYKINGEWRIPVYMLFSLFQGNENIFTDEWINYKEKRDTLMTWKRIAKAAIAGDEAPAREYNHQVAEHNALLNKPQGVS